MKNSIKYATLLFIVGSLCAVLVVGAVEYANPIIEARDREATIAALDTLYSDVDYSYEDITDPSTLNNYPSVVALFEVTANGETTYVYKIKVNGRNGYIDYLLELSSEGEILNISYIQQKETPGRGDKVTLDDFVNQFIGDTINDYSVETISGATISSTAMINSTNEALEHFENEVR